MKNAYTSNAEKPKLLIRALILGVFAFILCVMPVSAAGHTYFFSVTESGSISYGSLPIILDEDADQMVADGLMDADGLDTVVTTSGDVSLPTMVADDKILFASAITADTTTSFKLKTKQTPALNSYVILGEGGYITTADHADLELGASFDVTIPGYFNTAAAYVGENIVYKQDAFRVYVQAAGNIRAAVLSAGDTEDKAVNAAVASGYHTLKVYTVGSLLAIDVDGVRQDHEHMDIGTLTASTVDTDNSSNIWSHYAHGHNLFYANGRYWVFYYDNSAGNIVCESSTDGAAWGDKVTVATTTAGTIAVWFDGVKAHVSYRDMTNSDALYYRLCTPNADGTLTWSAVAQAVDDGLVSGGGWSLAVDTDGYPWLSYRQKTTGYQVVNKSSTKDGTWTNDTGYPLNLHEINIGTNEPSIIVPLTSGKMYCVWSDNNGGVKTIRGKAFNGSTWGALETPSNNTGDYHKDLVAYGDEVYLTFREIALENAKIKFAKRTGTPASWSGLTNITATAGLNADWSDTILSVDDSTGDLFCIWSDTDDYIHYHQYDYATSTWGAEQNLVDETGDDLVEMLSAGSYTSQNSILLFGYVSTPATPYKARVTGILLNDNSVPDNANNYIFMADDSASYADEISFTVSSTEVLLYDPINRISGTTLPDRAGTAQNGVITWGTNPVGIASMFITPTNLNAVPMSSTAIKLTWEQHATYTTSALFRKAGSYPSTPYDGGATHLYTGVLETFMDTGLSPGTTYYYRVWAMTSATDYSLGYAEDYATTHSGSAIVNPIGAPSTWFGTPVCTAYQNLPLIYPLIQNLTTSFGMPEVTGCVLATFFWILGVSTLSMIITRTSMIAVVTGGLGIGLAAAMELLPLWFLAFDVVIAGFIVFLWKRF